MDRALSKLNVRCDEQGKLGCRIEQAAIFPERHYVNVVFVVGNMCR